MDVSEILRGLEPSEQERKDALTQALFAFGLNTLAARGVNPMQAIGQGGMAGMGAYNGVLDDARHKKKEGLVLRQQLAQLMRQEKEQQRMDAQRAAIERAKQAGMVPGSVQQMAPQVAMDDEGGTMPTNPVNVPASFDPQRFLQAYMAEPDADPFSAMEMQAKLSKLGGWRKVGQAPGGGDLWVGPDGKPEVVGKQGENWVPVGEHDGGILMKEVNSGKLDWVGMKGTRVNQSVGGPKVVLDANAKQGSEYFHKELLPKMEAARQQNPRLQSMLKIKLDTNFFTPENKTLQSALNAVGLANKSAKEYVGKAEAFQADAMQIVLAEQQAQKGPQTDKDFLRIQDTVPKLRNSPKGNEYIIRMRLAQNNRLIRQAQFIGKLTAQGMDYINALQQWEASPEGQSSIFDDPVLKNFSFNEREQTGNIGSGVVVGRRLD